MEIIEHLPPRIENIPSSEPVMFFVGPIQGAPDWQEELHGLVRQRLSSRKGKLHIANPRVPTSNFHRSSFNKTKQIDWEKTYLRRAALSRGHVAVWLAKETSDAPVRNKPGRAYGQTTRFEFSRLAGWRDFDKNVTISFGMERGYTGSEDYYLHTAKELGLTICHSLPELCANVVNRQF